MPSASSFPMPIWFFTLFVLFCSKSWAELITDLPGQPRNVGFRQYSGYIVTDAKHGRALFYYFVEAQSSDPFSRPLTLWLNGGPGCSSLGFGAFTENGPLRPGENGVLVRNKYSWNLESNMLYVESPIGVGFSYSNTSSNYLNWTDARTAEDNLRFFLNWFEEFPMYRDSDLFLTGESYAGHYVPQLAALIIDYNKKPNVKPIKLKSIALGNPLLDMDISVLAGEYLWAHGVISDETLMLEKTVCNDSKYFREFIHNRRSKGCTDVFNRVAEEISEYVPHDNILEPLCLSSGSALHFNPKGKQLNIHAVVARWGNKFDPCLGDKILTYLNSPEVQKAIHANTTHLPYQWNFCQGPLKYQSENWETNIIPVVSEIIKEGIPVLLFSGDQDAIIPLTQTRMIAKKMAKDLKLLPLAQYRTWFDKQQVGGWAERYGWKNETYLTFATVRGAAHEVPYTSPSQSLSLFRSFLSGSPLPSHPSLH